MPNSGRDTTTVTAKHRNGALFRTYGYPAPHPEDILEYPDRREAVFDPWPGTRFRPQEENMFRRTSCHYHDEQFDRDTDRYTPDKTALLNAEARQQSRRDDRLASTRGGAACSPRGNDR